MGGEALKIFDAVLTPFYKKYYQDEVKVNLAIGAVLADMFDKIDSKGELHLKAKQVKDIQKKFLEAAA